MGNSIFEAMFYGKIIPWERRKTLNAERNEVEQNIKAGMDYFMEKLSPDDRQRIDELVSLYTQAGEDDDVDIFAYGFTMGVCIMLAVSDRWEGMVNE